MSKKTNKVANAPKSKGFLKFLSILLLAGVIAGFFVPFYFGFDGAMIDGSILGGEVTLFTLLMNTLQDGFSLDVITNNLTLSVIAIATVIFILFTLFTLFSKKHTSGLFRFICLVHFALLVYYAGNHFAAGGEVVDVLMLTSAVATVFMVLQAFGGGGKSFVPVLCFLFFTGVVAMSVMFPFFGGETVFFNEFNAFVENFAFTVEYTTFAYIAFALLYLNLFFTTIQMGFIRSNGFTRFRYFLLLAATVAAAVMAFISKVAVADMMYFLIFAGGTFVAFLFTIFASGKKKEAKAKKAAKEETNDVGFDTTGLIALNTPYPIYIQKQPVAEEPTTSKKSKKKEAKEEPVVNQIQPIIIDLNNYQ